VATVRKCAVKPSLPASGRVDVVVRDAGRTPEKSCEHFRIARSRRGLHLAPDHTGQRLGTYTSGREGRS
jgi:hypothetical protein